MAKSKKETTTRALDHGRSAFGAASVREGIALTPEDDLLLALGWPHLRTLDHKHRDDKKAEKAMMKVLQSLEGYYGDVWPAEVASRYVRAFGTRTSGFTERSPSVIKAIAVGGVEVEDQSAKEWLASLFTRSGCTGIWFVEHFVLLLEAFVGPDLVLESLVSGLESMGKLEREEEASYAAYTAGFVMLRVPPDSAEKARERLEQVRVRLKEGLVQHQLALLLGGAEKVKAYSHNPSVYHHVTDDPNAVLAAVKEGEWLPSVRLVQLGGEEVLRAFAPHWRSHRDRRMQLRLVEQLARLSSPLAKQILEEMAAKSKVKKQAAAALEARG